MRKIVKYVHSEQLLQQADKNPAVKGRATLTHGLIAAYKLLEHMQRITPKVCHVANLCGFHSQDYVQQFKRFKRNSKDGNDNDEQTVEDAALSYCEEEYGLGFDCPLWTGITEYVCHIAGATMTACDALCKANASTLGRLVIINLTGGWHHAQRDKAAGYCYVNDIVLGILVLRKRFKRILYVDLDVHHGDGVQDAFEAAKRVFTLSFHKYECGFYPATGLSTDCGFGAAKGYAANFPYKSGISGALFKQYFKRVTSAILLRYQPDVCVLQCGGDAIVGDPLGGTNLTPTDIIDCVSFITQQNLPTLVLGGGGYHFTNTSRFWTLLTATLCGQKLSDDIPDTNAHFLDYGPDYCLSIKASKFLKDFNTVPYLDSCAATIEANLKQHNVTAI